MVVDGVSRREIGTGQELRNLGCWSWMLLQGKKNTITRIINAYCPTTGAIAGGSYRRQLKYLTIMKN